MSPADKTLIQEAAKEATAYERKLMQESDEKLLAEFKKMPSVQLNTTDPALFKAATQKVWDAWEQKPFGDFVKKLRAVSK